MSAERQKSYPLEPRWHVTRGMTQYGWEVYETNAGALSARLYTRGEGVAIELAAQLNGLGARSREALLKDLETAV